MECLSLLVFLFSTWCVLSRHFADGILAKHLLSISAITSFITVVDKNNHGAAITSGVFLLCGLLYSYFRPTRKRPLFIDRRVNSRTFTHGDL